MFEEDIQCLWLVRGSCSEFDYLVGGVFLFKYDQRSVGMQMIEVFLMYV